MQRLFIVLALLSAILLSACGADRPAPISRYCTADNFPTIVGNSWRYVDQHGNLVSMTAKASPPAFNCASNPIYITIEKTVAETYWQPTAPTNLEWFLVRGAFAPVNIPDSLGYIGYIPTDMLTGEPRFQTSDEGVPLLTMPGWVQVTPGTSVAVENSVHYTTTLEAGGGPAYFGCPPLPDASNGFSASEDVWSAAWSLTTVSTPAYSGRALEVDFDEVSNGGVHSIEKWYFAHNIGVALIDATDPTFPAPGVVGSAHVILKLVDYNVRVSDLCGVNPAW